MAQWSKTSCPTSASKIFTTRIHVPGGLNPNEYLLLDCIEGLIQAKGQVGLSHRARAKRATRMTCLSIFLGWDNPHPIHLATLKTIMSHHGAGCIDEVVQIATTQSNNLSGTGFTEKFNKDSIPATSSPIPIPTSKSLVPHSLVFWLTHFHLLVPDL